MKHVFIINPAAGKGKPACELKPKIEKYCAENSLDSIIHVTSAAYEAIDFVRNLAKTGDHTRFYACGGDGTLFEVVNGAFGYPNAEVAVIPLGSGNDFIRLFGTKAQFLDIDAQVNGTETELDVIRCGDIIAINQCSMGFDAEINAKQASLKKLPFIKGESAYVAAMLYCFFKKLNNIFTITIDDGEPFTQNTLFCVAGNSRWYGGGFKAAPLAIPDDDLLDFIIVKKNMNRFKLLGLVNQYKAGQHLSWDFTNFVRGKKMCIHCDEIAAINCDGEKRSGHDATFEIVEKGIKFVIPANSSYFEDKAAGKLNA
jgi:YegS/Rv2252/BmrU family lipid kinase